ncbi:Hsp33 family molecular chaperone HslO [Pseudenhygromyxa sp. WMMC2535]|uniref:Hsp33 family molecular chaperone HslO n=1 Tax=Pseudenhygromyxa sp. WMMC2535 TaxID=2712867 RepID=UPI0015531EE1|nr:Hsp33 family molecular chaperone HslO [Pseudenhygromyxa sp. WMMC2535]NVB38034.1 Hsp33 family molecular chaperone HslO [Pseudenhygromyxa sp. WMMC2535]
MDALLRAINQPETMRVVAATTTLSVREACRRQAARGVEALAIGRAMTAGALLATLAKAKDERVRLQVHGGGPIGQLIIDGHGDGRVRACLSSRLPEGSPAAVLRDTADGSRPSTALAVGARGYLVITRDLGLARPYQGSVELVSGEVDEDIEHYLAHSEQLPSVLRTEVVLGQDLEVLRAAGVLVQAFPGADPALLAPVRERLVAGLRQLVTAHDREPSELVGLALGGEPHRDMLQHPVRFDCPCGPERALSVLSTLGAADLEQLADEQEQTEVRCNFCGDVTTVEAPRLRELAAELRRVQS